MGCLSPGRGIQGYALTRNAVPERPLYCGMREHLTQELLNVGLPVGDDTAAALAEFLAELAKWNEVHNLTAITDRDGVIRRHIIESLALRTLLKGPDRFTV